MVKKVLGVLMLILFGALSAAAQVNVRGQIFLADSSPPRNPIRFYLTRDDGMVNEYRYTDSNGRFILERLNQGLSYTLTFTSDDATYGDTVYVLRPFYDQTPRITLNPPPPRKPVPPSGIVSAATGYKPASRVAALYDRAIKEVEQNRLDAAETLLRQAIEQDPKFFAPRNDLGVLLMQQKKYAEAEEMFRRALELDPKSIHARLNLGIALNHQQKYTDATPLLREVLQLEPKLEPRLLAAGHLQLGIALVETDQFAEAEQELSKAEKNPAADQAAVQLYLGKLYARTGQFEKSIAAFKGYLEKAPNAANAAEVRALIERMQREASPPR